MARSAITGIFAASRAAAALLLVTASARPGPLRTNPNTSLYPDSSLVDFSYLLDRPAGKHGFLRVDGKGRFAWPDGRRARFWGVNISNRSVFVDRATIARVVDVLARSGAQMVRLEALDSFGGLLDRDGSDTTREIDPHKLDTVDFWFAQLKDRGIYVYLDLIDLRAFKAGDGVPRYQEIGRAARPYAMFDRRLIELQKEFARGLLLHRNPYTGLRYVDDPALALVEICNESGFFLRPESLDTMPNPYRDDLKLRWNAWLRDRYRSREALAKDWGVWSGVAALADDEDPRLASVRLPVLERGRPASGIVDRRHAPKRLADGVRFLVELQAAYFGEMRDYLRALGLKVPVTGVTSTDLLSDAASMSKLDFVAGNYYADHPAFSEAEWVGTPHYANSNPLRSASVYGAAPAMAALRWGRRPVVIREWATTWPNRFRAVSVPEMLAYASLQEVDAVLLFGYQMRPKPDALVGFGFHADPTVWGMFGSASLAYMRRDVRSSPAVARLRYTPSDVFTWPASIGEVLRLAWHVGVESSLSDRGLPDAGSLNARAGFAAAHAALTKAGPIGRFRGLDHVSATGQISRQGSRGILTVNASRTLAICGELGRATPVRVGAWTLATKTPVGALMVVSLDGLPLDRSRKWLAKMVSVAENSGQRLEPAGSGAPKPYRLTTQGGAPVRTLGQVARRGCVVSRSGRVLIEIDQMNGVWEVIVDHGRISVRSDTDDVTGRALGRSFRLRANRVATLDQGTR